MDLILTGRGGEGEEALRMGLVNRLVPRGQALDASLRLAVTWLTSPSDASGPTGYRPTSSGRYPTRRRCATKVR